MNNICVITLLLFFVALPVFAQKTTANDDIDELPNGLLKVTKKKGKEGKVYDSVEIEEVENEENEITGYFLKLERNGKYGIASIDGKILLPVVYEDVELLKWIENDNRKDAWFLVDNGDLYGVVNSKNEVVIPFEYDDIEVINRKDNNQEFFFSVNLAENKGLYTSDGQIIFTAEYDEISAVTCYVHEGEKKYFQELMSEEYYRYCGDILFFIAGKGYEQGLFSLAGDEIIPLRYSLLMLMEGYEPDDIITDFLFLVGDNQKYGVIASDGRIIVPVEYKDIEPDLQDGVITVHDEGETYYYRSTGQILLSSPD